MASLMKTPDVKVNFVPAKAGDTFKLGTINDRLGSAEFTVPPQTSGPPPHWHEMHDETFLVMKGKLRFHVKGGDHIDAEVGDYVTVPVRAPHTFSNPFDQEAVFFNTFTPSYYINYFKLLATMAEPGKPMDKAINAKAMSYFATIGVLDGL